jgi:hypothetical protein
MKKTNILWIILYSIFLIIFNLFFFLLGGTQHAMSVWISYGFIHLAYFLLIATPFLTRKGKSSTLFGLALASISAGYFLLEFVIGLVFIFIASEDIKATLLVQVCIAGLYASILIVNMLANEHTADAEYKRQNEIDYVKRASAQIKGFFDQIQDKEAKRKVERVYDTLCSSPTKSPPDLEQLENNMLQTINELEDAISAGNKDDIISLANTLLSSVIKRNTRLKSLN